VFADAEGQGVVLYFDEADALFGKRTGITSAHDRYANIETADLLSRMERFQGLAILATNRRQQIDAVRRRLRYFFELPAGARVE
jgi:SpoVK/Ycf46/Vps4 family AAA+-type ATPase